MTSFPPSLPQDQQTVIFGQAFKFWADVSGLSFSEVMDANSADIKIRYTIYAFNVKQESWDEQTTGTTVSLRLS